MMVVNLEPSTDTQWWIFKIYPLNGIQSYPCETRVFSGDGKEFAERANVLERAFRTFCESHLH